METSKYDAKQSSGSSDATSVAIQQISQDGRREIFHFCRWHVYSWSHLKVGYMLHITKVNTSVVVPLQCPIHESIQHSKYGIHFRQL